MAHPDLDTLLNPLLSLAQQVLAKRGAFIPFGASMKSNGDIAMVGGYLGEDQLEPVAIIELIVQGLQQDADMGKIRAAGVCIDMRVVPPGSTEKTDAICVQLEHISGECVDVYLPYRKGWLGRYKYGQIFAGPRDSRIFGITSK
ncbi:MAG: hypothetical protein J2P41_22575 [Blastocatellia bacterium]|nr:hypothetical protein [Blastocatellia bacterium]